MHNYLVLAFDLSIVEKFCWIKREGKSLGDQPTLEAPSKELLFVFWIFIVYLMKKCLAGIRLDIVCMHAII